MHRQVVLSEKILESLVNESPKVRVDGSLIDIGYLADEVISSRAKIALFNKYIGQIRELLIIGLGNLISHGGGGTIGYFIEREKAMTILEALTPITLRDNHGK